MDFSMDNSSISLAELESWKSAECFERFLESQRELVQSQIDQLQKIIVAQCRLTRANPLSKEMAAGALSITGVYSIEILMDFWLLLITKKV
ncbi:hypothetical protein Scep_007627 [Stephania cephalantha]|uniref:Uncharacterized protein n=1 Tax=Stephania cephalantha TaxID=152367 RepID=A0AAP0PP03_9MAGN